MTIDGRQIAKEILARTRERVAALGRSIVVRAVSIKSTPASESYLKIKESKASEAAVDFRKLEFGRESAEQTKHAIAEAGRTADAVIVQLPVPDEFNQTELCDAIPLGKDADVLSSVARSAFEQGAPGALLPPVVGAIAEICSRQGVNLREKRAVVVGQGFLVGAPVATWLEHLGAQVERVTVETPPEERSAALRSADVIVSGAGSPHLITPDLVREGVLLFDAGTSELGGKMVGDADPACADKCALFTPVPGGLGPIAVAKLFENAVTLASRA